MFCDFLPIVIFSAIFGARIYYVILNFEYFFRHPLEIIFIWHGGLSIHGAIIGGIVSLFLFLKIKKMPFLEYLDILSCVFPLGQAIGRWGNFFNQEAFGKPCNYFWCMYIQPQFRPLEYKNYDFFHPAFLYESILDFLLFIFLLFLICRVNKLKRGTVSGLYLILYSIIRIITEHFRLDASVYIFNISLPVFVSFLILTFSIIFVTYIYKKI